MDGEKQGNEEKIGLKPAQATRQRRQRPFMQGPKAGGQRRQPSRATGLGEAEKELCNWTSCSLLFPESFFFHLLLFFSLAALL